MITVITVVYNGAAELEKTIRSVLSQRCAMEVIIVDGGSTDGTIDIIRKFESQITMWVSEKDRGIYDAMNKGVSLAKGDFIIFMNSGDTFHDDAVLKDLAEFVDHRPGGIFYYGDAKIITGKGVHVQYQKDRHLDLTKSIIHQSMIIERKFLLENRYDLRFPVMADYDNLLKLTVHHPDKAVHVPRTVCIYNKFGVSSKPLYTYFNQYYTIAFRRMPFLRWVYFNIYILPRLVYSFKSLLTSK